MLEMVASIAEDDIKDSEMMVRYAEKSYIMNDMNTARFFIERAKQRIGVNFDSDHAKIVEMIREMKMQEGVVDAPESVQADCWNIMHTHYMDWVNSVKMRINELNNKIK